MYAPSPSFREGEKTAVMLVLDMPGMYGYAAYECPPKIAEKLGLPTEAVFVCCTHSHTPPWSPPIGNPATPSTMPGSTAVCATRPRWPSTT